MDMFQLFWVWYNVSKAVEVLIVFNQVKLVSKLLTKGKKSERKRKITCIKIVYSTTLYISKLLIASNQNGQ